MDLFGSETDYDPDDEDTDFAESVDEAAAPAEPTTPKTTEQIIGHVVIEQQLLDSFNAGRFPHALIFSGPQGIGKATMAYRVARFLLRHGQTSAPEDSLFGAPEPITHTSLNVNRNDPVFMRVASGGHTDLLSIERPYDDTKGRFKDTLPVEEVRKITPFLRLTAADGGWRVVIVDDADTMNRNAQNALLKILEEPPPHTVLILVAHRAGALLPTIRSRSRLIHFSTLSPDHMRDLLAANGHRPSAQELEIIMALSEGSIGKALHLLSADGIPLLGQILDLLDQPAPDWIAIHKFSDYCATTDHGFDLVCELMPGIFNRLARAKARKNKPAGFGVHTNWAIRTADATSLEALLGHAQTLEEGLTRVQFANLDKRQGILSAFAQVFN